MAMSPLDSPERPFANTLALEKVTLLWCLVLLATGLPLLVLYKPTAVSAGESLRIITFVAPYGWLLRNLHHWAAALLLISSALHLLRGALTGSYRPPRRLDWLLGLAALLLSGLLAFSGYVLRWDVDTVGALTAVAAIIQQTPLVGHGLHRLLVGGAAITDATLGRFYSAHILGLSLPLALLLAWGVWRARRSKRLRLSPPEGVALLALLCLLLGLALWRDAPLAPAVDGLSVPLTAVAPTLTTPWFLLWIPVLLHYLPPAGIGVAALLLLLVAALLPWLIDLLEGER